jgi:hypothetical protein
MTDQGALAPLNTFVEKATVLLPAVEVFSIDTLDKQATAHIKQQLNKVPRDLLTTYQLTRVNETETWLRDKQQASFSLIFNDQLFIDEQKISCATHLKNDLDGQGKFSKIPVSQWVVDCRFENQMILFPEKRGC